MAVTALDLRSATRIEVQGVIRPGALFSVLVAAAAFTRVAVARAHEGMWADDGVYLEVVHSRPPWESVLYAHHGYLNLGQMMIASSLEWVPISYAPVAFVAAWAVGVGLLASYVAAISEPVLSSMWSRAFLGASVGLIPIAGYESAGTVANLQWSALAAVTIAVVVAPETSRVTPWLIFVTAASAPAALALAPFVWWRRERRLVAGAWLLGVGAQLIAVAATWGSRDASGQWWEFERIIQSFASVAVNGVTAMSTDVGRFTALGVLVVVLVAVAAMHDGRGLAAPALMVAAALVQWWFTYTGGGAVPIVPRYGIVPAICVLALLLASAERLGRGVHVSVLVVLAVCWIAGGPVSDYRTAGADWTEQISETPCVDGVRRLELQPTGWGRVAVPCD